MPIWKIQKAAFLPLIFFHISYSHFCEYVDNFCGLFVLKLSLLLVRITFFEYLGGFDEGLS